MDRGYLYLLIGALLKATTLLPFDLNLLPFFRLDFIGYLLILTGVREMRTSSNELKNAYYFAVATLLLRFIPFLLSPINAIMPVNILGILPVLNIFFSVGIFFWLFKAEYMWSPHTSKRMDWLIYSIVALIKLVFYIALSFAMIDLFTLPLNLWQILEGMRFINILYYIVLIYILVKLYLEARGDAPGFKRRN